MDPHSTVLVPTGTLAQSDGLTKSVITHIDRVMTGSFTSATEIAAACVCLAVNRAARRVARRYDDMFRPLGITSGQFSMLAALMRDEAVPLGVLADTLGMDRTTLNRNLKPLEAEKLVTTTTDKRDRRVRGLALTDQGRDLLDRAIPIWRLAQSDSERRLQTAAWPALRSHLQNLL